ncbi:KH domain RNA binding protein YlqC [Geminocystis sp. NIES-3708]|uniref:KH domain-containing protein n=1 Tax=Geminocystis sp. NIES-3708 TaxID=1615909 RepID=UPI0005FCBF07|nr:KH domain-containing protein [Geminocystis sp. NIES-3708]BAQ62017.1 KH domain RNA binding protein YlqC [Geminocystis sp. NIES-3708]
MLNSEPNININSNSKPDYDGLVRFLIEPLLDSPELLSFDCEQILSTRRVWIRLAFEENEKGKVYGRGGRNIQAVRTVLQTAAQVAGDTLYLEIYEDQERSRLRRQRPPTRPSVAPRPSGQDVSRPPIRRRTPVIKPEF